VNLDTTHQREHAHAYLDRLADDQLSAVCGRLETMLSPLERALARPISTANLVRMSKVLFFDRSARRYPKPLIVRQHCVSSRRWPDFSKPALGLSNNSRDSILRNIVFAQENGASSSVRAAPTQSKRYAFTTGAKAYR
jgi:hypothetical protein